jgi:hypothetical protein
MENALNKKLEELLGKKIKTNRAIQAHHLPVLSFHYVNRLIKDFNLTATLDHENCKHALFMFMGICCRNGRCSPGRINVAGTGDYCCTKSAGAAGQFAINPIMKIITAKAKTAKRFFQRT